MNIRRKICRCQSAILLTFSNECLISVKFSQFYLKRLEAAQISFTSEKTQFSLILFYKWKIIVRSIPDLILKHRVNKTPLVYFRKPPTSTKT